MDEDEDRRDGDASPAPDDPDLFVPADPRADALLPFGRVWDGRRPPDPVFGRDAAVAQVIDQIDRVGRSFVVVGPPGVGKTAIIRAALEALAARDSASWRFAEVTTGMLVAGQSYFGQWQEQVKKLLAAAPRRQRVGVWVGDLPNLFNCGRTRQSEDNIGDFVTPSIDHGDLLLFGEATPEVHSVLLAAAPAVSRLFDTIAVEPQTPAEAAASVAAVAAHRAAAAGERRGMTLRFAAEAVERCVQLGETFFPALHRPAGAIRLVEGVLEDPVLGPLLGEPATGPATGAAPAPSAGAQRSFTIPPQAVIECLCALTGAPRALLDDALPLPPADVRRFFESRIVGQRRAIDAVVDLVAMIKAGLADPARPAGVLLFVGPTGVGKTELARALAEFIFGSPERLVRLDMSEYARPDGHHLLLRTGDDGKGLLARVRRQPMSVILLDEIEKAHPAVFDLLLQLFDAGRLSSPSGETVNFTQSVIILTSNLGSGEPPAAGFGFKGAEPVSADEWIRDAVAGFFRPELVNRLGRIVVFDPLDRAQVRTLAQRELGAVLLRGGITRRRLQVDVDRGVVDLLARQGYDPRFGARPLKRAVERIVLGPLAHVLSEMPSASAGTVLHILPSGDAIRVVPLHDDRAAREPEVSLDDPFEGVRTKAGGATLRRWLAELEAEVARTRADHERSGLPERRSEAVARTAARDFWDDAPRARATLAELYRAERTGEAVRECAAKAAWIAEEVARVGRGTGADEIARLAAEIARCRRQAVIVRFAMLCASDLGSADAFVVHDALDTPGREHVRPLAESHAAWARRMGFEVVEVHEEGKSRAGVRQVVLQINGAAVSAILEAQAGIHEFLPDAKSARRMVRVTVMPVPTDLPAAGAVAVEAVPRPGKRTEWRASHRASGCAIAIRPDAPGDVADTLARELLTAEMLRQEGLRAGQPAPGVVRRWWMGARPSVRDPRTGASVARIKDVLAGDIDAFLVAYLEARRGAVVDDRPTA